VKGEDIMQPRNLMHRIVSCAMAIWFSLCASLCLADTEDLTESLSGSVGAWRCAGAADSLGVFADVDANGTFDTLVVFTTVEGEARADGPSSSFGYGRYLYFFTGDRSHCGGTTGGTGRIGIRFVDMLAPGFNPNDRLTWTYKAVPGVQLVTFSDSCVENGASAPYRQVRAFTQINGGGIVVGTFTAPGPFPPQQTCDFNHAAGIKEIQVRSDFCENSISHLIIRSGSTSVGQDIGLRVHDGSGIIRVAAEPAGTLTSPMRIARNGTIYGIVLTDPGASDASRIRVNTSSGVKAWAKLP